MRVIYLWILNWHLGLFYFYQDDIKKLGFYMHSWFLHYLLSYLHLITNINHIFYLHYLKIYLSLLHFFDLFFYSFYLWIIFFPLFSSLINYFLFFYFDFLKNLLIYSVFFLFCQWFLLFLQFLWYKIRNKIVIYILLIIFYLIYNLDFIKK